MSIKPLRIAFMGTPEFTIPVLEALLQSSHQVVCVYTQPPRPSGRGNKIKRSSVHEYAAAKGIEVRTPESLKKDAKAREEFAALALDAAVIAGYGMMLPDDVLDGPRFGSLNVHPSILPRWRGTSPVQFTIWAGDEKAGVTVMRLIGKMDSGPIAAIETVPVGPKTTAPDLDRVLWPMGGRMLVAALDDLAAGKPQNYTPQDDSLATYARLLKREDGCVDWTKTAAQIDRQIRALNPWPGVWTLNAEGKRLKIIEAELTGEAFTEPPGTLVDRLGHIACGEDTALRLIKIQPENAKPMDLPAALNGNYLKVDEVLG